MRPYKQIMISEGIFAREFSNDVDSEELVWHRDREDRSITVTESPGWKLQMDNKMPVKMSPGDKFFIPALEWHRVIKGPGNLLIEVDTKSANPSQYRTPQRPKHDKQLDQTKKDFKIKGKEKMRITRRQLRKIVKEEMAHPRDNLGKNIADVDFPIVVGYSGRSEIAYDQDELDDILDMITGGPGSKTNIPYSLDSLDDMEPNDRPVGADIERFTEGKVKITKKQIRMIIEAYGDASENIRFQIAMKIKDMMPAEEAINMRDQDFEDLMVSVYEQHFDETNEGWAPYPEDIEEIRNHLVIRDH